MTNRKNIRLTAYITVLTIVATAHSTLLADESESATPAADSTGSTVQPANVNLSPELKEIMAIRELFGPRLIGERILDKHDFPTGNESPRQDSSTVETEFREALRKISASEPALSPLIRPWREEDWIRERQSDRDSLVAALRNANEQLEREIQRLEGEQRYERARELRKLAKRVRKEMRLFAELANVHE